ncbi:nucleotidyltransferase family protein [Herbaspirillum sp. B65]|uniref:nucleotidyltransferase family protein n=1 Tax=Herbaspirillum sp. B65 TaxID=137708 RepID=UPI00209142C9|nr:nucleotidyltransferase family protein [Herbaspirillum sp. B65]
MRALLLAAGLGTRLRPLTDFLPKCLVPVAGRPLLDYWIETLLRQGVEDILINTHYRADLVERYIAASTWCDRVTLVHEPQLLGTAGTALTHRQFFGEQPFLLAHADNLTRFDCRDFLSTHRNSPQGPALTMMLFRNPGSPILRHCRARYQRRSAGLPRKTAQPPGQSGQCRRLCRGA